MWEHVRAKSACRAVSRGDFIEFIFIHLWCGSDGITKTAFSWLAHFINVEMSDQRVVKSDQWITMNGNKRIL